MAARSEAADNSGAAFHLTYRYRIYPNKEQERLINDTFGCARFIYNKMLEEKQAFIARKKIDPLLPPQRRRLPADYKKEYPWLKAVDSLALANAQRHLEAAFNNFLQNRAGFPRFKSKRRDKQTYMTNNQKGSVRLIDDRTIQLPKLKKVKIKLHRPLPPAGMIKGAAVSKSRSGNYYVSVLLAFAAQSKPLLNIVRPSPGPAAAVNDIETDNDIDKKIDRLKQIVLNRRKGGKNRLKGLRKLARLYEKAANRKNDRLHKLSRRIANAAGSMAGAERLGIITGESSPLLRKLLIYKLAAGRYLGAGGAT